MGVILTTWNPKQPFINGCFKWMIPNLYIRNGCFIKHLFINGCLGFQALTNWDDPPSIVGIVKKLTMDSWILRFFRSVVDSGQNYPPETILETKIHRPTPMIVFGSHRDHFLSIFLVLVDILKVLFFFF